MHYKKVKVELNFSNSEMPVNPNSLQNNPEGRACWHRLDPNVRKDVKCLRCNKTFIGSTRNRICESCHKTNESYSRKSYKVVVD